MSIKEYREHRGVTREYLCQMTGVPYKSLQNWELGRRKPAPYLVDLLKRAIDDLAGESNE